MNYWLLKTDAEDYSVDDLKKDKRTLWTGVRNYQARNFLMAMKRGDKALIYHSNTEFPGIFGIGEIGKTDVPDPTQFDSESPYFDLKGTKESPVWKCSEVIFKTKLKHFVGLETLRKEKLLQGLMILRKGNRLSVTPVTEEEFLKIVELGSYSK